MKPIPTDFKPSLKVGVLGGMGPYATVSFYEKVLRNTPAKKDWNHLRLIIDNNPHIPSRSRAYLYGEDSPVDAMVESCLKLQSYPVDVIVMPCNSATFFIEDVKSRITIPLLNIVEITVKRVKRRAEKKARVSVFGGNITYYEKLYKPHLINEGLIYVEHEENFQQQIIDFIETIKLNGSIDNQLILTFIDEYCSVYNPDVIILGCTEFGFIADIDSRVVLIDSDTELAKHIVNLAYNNEL